MKEVLETTQTLGHAQVAITDINNTSETFRFIKLAKEYNVEPSVGIDFRNGIDQQYIGLAKNNNGFFQLNEHLSHHLEKEIPFESRAPFLEDTFIIYPLRKAPKPKNLKPNEYIGVSLANLKHPTFQKQWKSQQHKLVVLCTATFRNKKDYNAHRLLRAIGENSLLSKLPRNQQASMGDQYRSKNELQDMFVEYPQIIENTLQILTCCKVVFDFNQPRNNKLSYTDSVEEDVKLLRKLSYEGLPYRYGPIRVSQPTTSSKGPNQPNQPTNLNEADQTYGSNKPDQPTTQPTDQPKPNQQTDLTNESDSTNPTNPTGQNQPDQPTQNQFSKTIIDRLENELKLIQDCNFCAYFLINWDLVNYAQNKNYPYVGRGSGANSMVAYLLKITNVDPIDLDLYFERFINPYRNTPPDFDVDFSWTDREDITQYLFNKYGWDRVALLGSYQTYQKRAVIRELGKVFGLPDEEIKRIQLYGTAQDEYGKIVKKYSDYIHGFPSHLSIHASGILISEKPIHYFAATHLPPKNYPTTHFDMQVAEDIGLHKYDILSQRGLGKIKDAIELIYDNRGEEIDINDMERIKDDPRVKKMLKEGDLTGCFYVESPAMRMLMTKLRAEDYTRLVAASSIIRPGVAKSGMMREYILRFQDKKRREAARRELPELYEILKETYGVMVYQEDVIKVAHFFADLTLAQADVLRRGMSWKFKQRNEFASVRQTFFQNCDRKGYPQKTVLDIWNQIESFANFAFSKGHSASYAVESFQAVFLAAYYPLEYLTATLNNGGGFYSRELYVHSARMKGAKFELPCVNRSSNRARIVGNTIYLGLGFISGGFESENVRAIIFERVKATFKSFRDFVTRLPQISLEQLTLLIRLGCFRVFEPNKKKLLWDAHFLLSKTPKVKVKQDLFQLEPKKWKLPELVHTRLEDAYDEMELLGFPVSLSPFELVEEKDKISGLKAAELTQYLGKKVVITGYRVHVKRTKTSNHMDMQFGTFIDQSGDWIDAVIFPNTYDKTRPIAPGCYNIEGEVSEEFGHVSIEVEKIERLNAINIRE
tara:strand:+ start:5839 stop:8973 length:3135 start_codon:yes stop_codon:yes gene_type:complete